MNAEERISKAIGEGVATLSGRWDTQLTYLGSNCKASVHPGDRVPSFSVSLEANEEAVVGVKTSRFVTSGKHGDWEYGHFLFRVSRKGEEMNVDLGDFVPKPDKFGQVVPDAGLSVRIGDEFFLSPLLVSDYHTEEKLAKLKEKYRLVSTENANLLCRFIAGKATAEEVKAVADELVVQTVDVPALQARLAQAEQQVVELGLGNRLLSAGNRALKARISEMERRLEEPEQLRRYVLNILQDKDAGATSLWQQRKTAKLERIADLVKDKE